VLPSLSPLRTRPSAISAGKGSAGFVRRFAAQRRLCRAHRMKPMLPVPHGRHFKGMGMDVPGGACHPPPPHT